MKSILLPLLLLFVSLIDAARATEQQSDLILLEGQKCELETHWMYPSPLQAYYLADPPRKYPFREASTGNYRGHVATWEIADKRLYLVDIETRGEQALPKKGRPLLKKLFPQAIEKSGKVFASWFDGNLRVYSKPAKHNYQHPQDSENRETDEFTEVILLQLNAGVVVRQTRFSRAEYWKKFQAYLEYRKLKTEEVTAISEHVAFIDRQSKDWENIGDIEPKGPARTEKDFEFFLTRYWVTPVKIPLSRCEIVRDIATDPADRGWTLDSNLRNVPDSHLLMLEMNDVPSGPWNPFTPGSVQVLIQLGKLESKEVAFSGKSPEIVKFINNFGDHSSSAVEGKLKIDRAASGEVTMTGYVKLTSEGPTTHQEVAFGNQKIPVLSIEDYLKRHNPPGEGLYDVTAILERIRANSKR